MQHLINTAFQVGFFVMIASVFWGVHLLRTKDLDKRESFCRYLGLFLPKHPKRSLWIFLVAILCSWIAVALHFWLIEDYAAFSQKTPAFLISHEKGLDRIIGVITYPFLMSALSEEILFRGLIAKRLITRFGYALGNALQTVAFLFPHVLLVVFFAESSPSVLLIMLVTVGPMAWVAGSLMHKRDQGSILSAWLLHAGLNFGTMTYFLLWVN